MKTYILLPFLFLCQIVFGQTFTVVSENLRLPLGLEFDAQGRLWVVETGYGFDDGAVSIVNADGSLLPVVADIPSLFDTTTMENVGPWHTLQLPGNKFALTVATLGKVLTFDLTGFTPGVTPPLTAASSTSSLDIASYVLANGFLETDPYTVTTDAAGNMYVADAAANAIIKADVAGQLSVFTNFPVSPNPIPVGPPVYDAVPTRIVAKPGGGFYVCQLTGFPFVEGAASVYSIDQNGVATPYATGFTMLTDMVLDTNTGDLYVLQFGKFDLSIFDIAPNSSKITRIKTDGTQEVVAEGTNLSPGMAIDAQGNIYVSELASGRILLLDNSTASKEPAAGLFNVSLSPNPATEHVLLAYSLTEPSPVIFRVLDAQGKLVFSQNVGKQPAGSHQLDWRCNGQPSGLYWLDIQTDKGTKTQQLVIH